jgi:hypothetical protein
MSIAVVEPESDWTDSDWNVFESSIKELLHNKLVTVKFTKKDGSERVMHCTLQTDLLPPQEIKENKEPRKRSDTSIAVYDVQANGWRSFTYRSVYRIEYAVD